jgi:hypothetical protein
MPHTKDALSSAGWAATSTWPNEQAAFVVDGYLALWSEADATRRGALVRATWTPDGRYIDPTTYASGHHELEAMFSEQRVEFLGRRYQQVGGIDTHHGRLHWRWLMSGPESAPVSGVSFAVIAPDGRLREVNGFFESRRPDLGRAGIASRRCIGSKRGAE